MNNCSNLWFAISNLLSMMSCRQYIISGISDQYIALYYTHIYLAEMEFNNLGVDNWLLRVCEKIGYRHPTDIQQLSFKPILNGESIIANAETGSGKTAAFAFPLLQRLAKDPYGIFSLVIVPSRQLAVQIHEQLAVFGQNINLRQALLIGGTNYLKQNQELDNIPHIVVGTPGRIAQLLENNETFKKYISNCGILVLDEADRLFDESLLEDMEKIILKMTDLKQLILDTATIDNKFQGKILKSILNQPHLQLKKYSTYDKMTTVPTLIQQYLFIPQGLKPGYLLSILQKYQNQKIIIFVKTCKQCHLLFFTLKKLEYKVSLLHSVMKQTKRMVNLLNFRNQKTNILVTTDLAARGLDIKCVDLVINLSVPRKLSDYIHRVGRTARKGLEGEALTLITEHEVDLFLEIEKGVGVKMEQLKIKEEEALEELRRYNKAMREAKMYLANNGMLEEFDKKKEEKKNRMAQRRHRVRDGQGQ